MNHHQFRTALNCIFVLSCFDSERIWMSAQIIFILLVFLNSHKKYNLSFVLYTSSIFVIFVIRFYVYDHKIMHYVSVHAFSHIEICCVVCFHRDQIYKLNINSSGHHWIFVFSFEIIWRGKKKSFVLHHFSSTITTNFKKQKFDIRSSSAAPIIIIQIQFIRMS